MSRSILCACFVLLLFGQCSTKSKEESAPAIVAAPSNDLPQLGVIKPDGSKFDLRSIQGKAILIFFNPECDHCQRVAEQIKLRKPLFSEHQLYFVSTEPAPALLKFAQQYQLIGDNILFVQANPAEVFEAIGNLPSVPAIFIYDNRKFIKRFDGETSLDVIQQFL